MDTDSTKATEDDSVVEAVAAALCFKEIYFAQPENRKNYWRSQAIVAIAAYKQATGVKA